MKKPLPLYKRTIQTLLTTFSLAILSSCGSLLYPIITTRTAPEMAPISATPNDYYSAYSEKKELRPELRAALQEQTLNLLLLNSDEDQDKQLNLNEFNYGLLPMNLFRIVDNDQDGQVQRQELWAYQQKISQEINREFNNYGYGTGYGTGYNASYGMVGYASYSTGYEHNNPQQPNAGASARLFQTPENLEAHTRSAFAHGDTNQDQYLDLQELKQAFALVALFYEANIDAWAKDERLNPLSEALIAYVDQNQDRRITSEELSKGLWELFNERT